MLIPRYSLFESRQNNLDMLKVSIEEQYCQGKHPTGQVSPVLHQDCSIRNLVETGNSIHFVCVLTTTEDAKTQVNTAMQTLHKNADFTDFNLDALHISGKYS